ncbi:hypothetical protein T09_7872 [Trichinella sp. T9]|nr:hypothetical protein T09_7872 [Trichinella sp. T9]
MNNEKHPLDDLKNDEITEKRKMRNPQCSKIGREILKNVKNEKCTL